MVSFYSIKNFRRRKKVMDSFFSIKNVKSCKVVVEFFLVLKALRAVKKVTDSFFSGHASLSFHMMLKFPRSTFSISSQLISLIIITFESP